MAASVDEGLRPRRCFGCFSGSSPVPLDERGRFFAVFRAEEVVGPGLPPMRSQ